MSIAERQSDLSREGRERHGFELNGNGVEGKRENLIRKGIARRGSETLRMATEWKGNDESKREMSR